MAVSAATGRADRALNRRGLRVWGLGFRIFWGLGFRVLSSGLVVLGLGF